MGLRVTVTILEPTLPLVLAYALWACWDLRGHDQVLSVSLHAEPGVCLGLWMLDPIPCPKIPYQKMENSLPVSLGQREPSEARKEATGCGKGGPCLGATVCCLAASAGRRRHAPAHHGPQWLWQELSVPDLGRALAHVWWCAL